MNSANHHKVIALAVQGLPERSRPFWAALESTLLETCMLPDEVAIPLLNGEDGPWRRFFPSAVPQHSFEKHGASARAHFFDVEFYVDHIVALMAQGEVQEACRFLGVLSHSLGDFAEPAHYCEAEITLLLPPPAELANCKLSPNDRRYAEHDYRACVPGTPARPHRRDSRDATRRSPTATV